MNFNALLDSLHTRWQSLAARERAALAAATVVVLGALALQTVLLPAWRTWRSAEVQAQALDAQLQQLRQLQQQALALRANPPLGYDEALRALAQSTQQTLGASGDLSITAEQARATLKGASADALARWLHQVRVNARLLPQEVHITRASPTGPAIWNGVVVFALPRR